MSLIKDALASLTEAERKDLLYALEQELTKWIQVGKHFVGVNISNLPQLHITETNGPWAYGDMCE